MRACVRPSSSSDFAIAAPVLPSAGDAAVRPFGPGPSVEIGHTPYVRDAADLARFWAWWDGVLDQFDRAGVRPIRAHEIIDALDRGAG